MVFLVLLSKYELKYLNVIMVDLLTVRKTKEPLGIFEGMDNLKLNA